MTTSRDVTIWDYFSMGMWSVLFAIGLVPEFVFHGLRAAAHISKYTAFVNSSAIITLALAGYIAFFVSRQSRAGGISIPDSQAKAIHAALLSILAFIEIPGQSPVFGIQTLLGLMLQSELQVEPSMKVMLWVVGCTKLAAWIYLYTLMLRFHVLGNREVFSKMRTFFIQYDDHEPQKKTEVEDVEVTSSADEKQL